MANALDARQVIDECKVLQDYWSARNDKIKSWYDVLLMKDEFAQEGMESFVSNDPRTFYNLALHLLCADIPHRIPTADLEAADMAGANIVEDVINKAWAKIDGTYRMRGDQEFLRNLAGLILTTGWYAVFAFVDDLGFVAEVWNVMQVYPEWDEEGLVKLARIYKIPKAAIARKVKRMKWAYNKPITTDLDLYNYWYIDENAKVHNIIVLGDVVVKPDTVEKFDRIPVFVGPVGGLPDTGIINDDNTWKEHRGESVLATNELVYKSYNKQWTFSSQLLRDTAQPRWFEKSASGNILKPETIFKRGAIFKGGIQDDVGVIPMPPMPIELRMDRMDIQNMLQRGGLPWTLFGNVQQQIAGYMMSQIASAAQQILQPYHKAIINVLSDIDNFWLDEIKNKGFNPFKVKKLKILDNFKMTADYTLKIPGDLVQRATVARMMCPTFELSATTTMDLMFPEIHNPIREQALARKDRAMSQDIAVMINTIAAYKQNAQYLRANGDSEQAALYEKAAASLEQQLSPQQQQMPTQPTPFTQKPRQEAMPRQATEVPQELSAGMM